MKVVVNRCFGGFSLSEKASKMLNELEPKAGVDPKYGYLRDDSWRSNKNLIKVVEELGEEANGDYAELEIVEIPDGVDFIIEEYDGSEHVAEAHRTW